MLTNKHTNTTENNTTLATLRCYLQAETLAAPSVEPQAASDSGHHSNSVTSTAVSNAASHGSVTAS